MIQTQSQFEAARTKDKTPINRGVPAASSLPYPSFVFWFFSV